MKDLVGFIGVILLMIGGCGVMNSDGNIQPIAVTIAMLGAVVILLVTRGTKR